MTAFNELVIQKFSLQNWQAITSDFISRSSSARRYHNQQFHNVIIDTALLVQNLTITVEKDQYRPLPLCTI